MIDIYQKHPPGYVDYAGDRLGGFRVLGFHERVGPVTYWWVECLTCREVFSRGIGVLGFRKPAKCIECSQRAKPATKHNMCYTRVYSAWRSVKDGNHVVDRWKVDFIAFLSHMGHPPKDTIIRRVDESKKHGPGNSIWATVEDTVELGILKIESLMGDLGPERREQLSKVSRQRRHQIIKRELKKLSTRLVRRPVGVKTVGWICRIGEIVEVKINTLFVRFDDGTEQHIPRRGLRSITYKEQGPTEVNSVLNYGLLVGEPFTALKITRKLAGKLQWIRKYWIRCPSTYYRR
jgi:hypothetical protein